MRPFFIFEIICQLVSLGIRSDFIAYLTKPGLGIVSLTFALNANTSFLLFIFEIAPHAAQTSFRFYKTENDLELILLLLPSE